MRATTEQNTQVRSSLKDSQVDHYFEYNQENKTEVTSINC